MEEKFMKEALKCAKAAFRDDEVPIGAVVVLDGKVISRGRNRRVKKQIATAHAEVEAIEKACKKLGSWRLPDCELYVTLEPCPMCLGAMLNARIKKVYFGAWESKGRSLTAEIASAGLLNHKLEYEGGIMEEECKAILSGYFEAMRLRTHWRNKGLPKTEEDPAGMPAEMPPEMSAGMSAGMSADMSADDPIQAGTPAGMPTGMPAEKPVQKQSKRESKRSRKLLIQAAMESQTAVQETVKSSCETKDELIDKLTEDVKTIAEAATEEHIEISAETLAETSEEVSDD